MNNIGIFEVDCRQGAEKGDGLSYVSRALPFENQIAQIHAFAQENQIPLVFTTCCSNRLLTKEKSAGALFVPMDPKDTEWEKEVKSSSLIYIEKTTWGSPKINTQHCAWDMFRHNSNAQKLFNHLGINHWIVYGVGIDLCVNSAVRGLLASGCQATILDDILVNNASGTAETMKSILADYQLKGVNTMTSLDLLSTGKQAVA